MNGADAIVNLAKLPAARHDAVCMQCHLEGNAAIERTGKHLYEYRPGDNLSDYVRYYILADSEGTALRASCVATYPEASVVVVPPEGWLTDICDMHSSMTATRAAIRPVSGDFRIIIAAIDWQSGSHHFETAPM